MLKRCTNCQHTLQARWNLRKCPKCKEKALEQYEEQEESTKIEEVHTQVTKELFEEVEQVMQEPKGGEVERADETPAPPPPWSKGLGFKYKPFIEWREQYPQAYEEWLVAHKKANIKRTR